MSAPDPRIAAFVGIPYEECVSAPGALDGCWGLAVRVYAACGVTLPRLGPDDLSAESVGMHEIAVREWRTVAEPHGPVGSPLEWLDAPMLLDIVYSRVLGHPHVGLLASEDGRWMLHTHAPNAEKARCGLSHVVPLDRRPWRNVVAVYRPPRGQEALIA